MAQGGDLDVDGDLGVDGSRRGGEWSYSLIPSQIPLRSEEFNPWQVQWRWSRGGWPTAVGDFEDLGVDGSCRGGKWSYSLIPSQIPLRSEEFDPWQVQGHWSGGEQPAGIGDSIVGSEQFVDHMRTRIWKRAEEDSLICDCVFFCLAALIGGRRREK